MEKIQKPKLYKQGFVNMQNIHKHNLAPNTPETNLYPLLPPGE